MGFILSVSCLSDSSIFSVLFSQLPGMLAGFALLQNIPDNPLGEKDYLGSMNE